MQVPVSITFHGMTRSEAAEAAIGRCVENLVRVHDRIQHCHVWIDRPHQRSSHVPFQIRIMLTLPGGEIAVSHDPGDADVYVALGDAFEIARRQLRDYVKVQRGEVKSHVA
jgi:ribosome-associated translation inhibitor RaiA